MIPGVQNGLKRHVSHDEIAVREHKQSHALGFWPDLMFTFPVIGMGRQKSRKKLSDHNAPVSLFGRESKILLTLTSTIVHIIFTGVHYIVTYVFLPVFIISFS